MWVGIEGTQKSNTFSKYLDSNLKMAKSIPLKIPKQQKPKLLHINLLSPLAVDSNHSIIDTWIKASGGKNATFKISENMKEISLKQILK